MKNPTYTLIKHPLITHKISLMRHADVRMSKFYDLTRELGVFLGVEITRSLTSKLVSKQIERFPDGELVDVEEIENKDIAIVPILRSGLVVAEGFREVVSSVRTGHLGFTRDRITKEVEPYLVALPKVEGRTFVILDTVVATGDTALRAIQVLHEIGGVPMTRIKVGTILIAPKGLERIQDKCPEVEIYALCEEKGLDPDGLVVPGFGDSNDRLFGYY